MKAQNNENRAFKMGNVPCPLIIIMQSTNSEID
jgi:hypothetical protein